MKDCKRNFIVFLLLSIILCIGNIITGTRMDSTWYCFVVANIYYAGSIIIKKMEEK